MTGPSKIGWKRIELMTNPQREKTPAGPCDNGFGLLDAWDPQWAATCRPMAGNPWTTNILPRKTVEID